jgi:hypothetical protein
MKINEDIQAQYAGAPSIRDLHGLAAQRKKSRRPEGFVEVGGLFGLIV